MASLDQVLGRFHERGAYRRRFREGDGPNFGLGGLQITENSSSYDQRLNIQKPHWFWADTRTAQLDLESFNGLLVSRHNQPRTAEHEYRVRQIVQDLATSPEQTEQNQARNITCSSSTFNYSM
jgi:hypothetical protein